MHLNTIVVEDEAPARELLVDYVISNEHLNLGAVAKNGREALEKLNEHQYDLCFLDINLPFLTGLQVLEQLDYTPYVIFTTVYKEYVYDAFEVGAVDYLLKPISRERFDMAVERAYSQISSIATSNVTVRTDENPGILLQHKGVHHFVRIPDIVYLTANNKNTVIHTKSQDLEVNALIKDLHGRLPQTTFVRIHKKYVINLNYLDRMETEENGKFTIFLKNDDETILPAGTMYVRHLRDQMGM